MKGELLPENDWMSMERVLAELESTTDQELIRLRETLVKRLVNRRNVMNCIGLWRMTRRLRSQHQQEMMNYILEVLVRAVQRQIIDMHFYRLPMFDVMLLLKDDGLKVRNELDVFDVLLAWTKAWPERRKALLPEMAIVVRKAGLPEKTNQLDGLPLQYWRLGIEKGRSSGLKLLLIGGWEEGPRNDVLLLDHVNETWERLSLQAPYAAAYHGLIWLDGELFLFGGGDNLGIHYNELFKLNRDLKWEQLASMNHRRCYISNSCIEIEGRIWVMGGHDGARSQRTRLRSVEYYDPESNSWTLGPQMRQPRSDAAAAVAGGKIFVCGGFNGREILQSVEFLDPVSDVWTEFRQMPAPRAGLSIVSDGRYLTILGGFNGRDRFATVWKMDTEDRSGRWTELPPMRQGRSNFTAARLGGELFVAGGYYFDRTVSTVESFDGSEWRDGPALIKGRSALRSVVLPLDGANAIRELFPPVTD